MGDDLCVLRCGQKTMPLLKKRWGCAPHYQIAKQWPMAKRSANWARGVRGEAADNTVRLRVAQLCNGAPVNEMAPDKRHLRPLRRPTNSPLSRNAAYSG